MKKVALTGSSGIVGQFIRRRLQAENCQVTALERGDVELGSEIRPELLAKLLEGCDSLIHAAFQHAPGRYRGGEGEDIAGFWEANFMGTWRLLKAARAAGITRVLLLSSRAVFTNPAVANGDSVLDDDFPQHPDSHYGALKVASEKLGQAIAATGSMIVSSLRPTGVYGLVAPLERTKWYELARQTLTDAAAGTTAADRERVTTEVHGQDVAAAAWLLLTAGEVEVNGKGFNCSDVQVSQARVQHIMATGDNIAGSGMATSRMSCDGLERLGWQPGGEELLFRTIAELMTECRARAATD